MYIYYIYIYIYDILHCDQTRVTKSIGCIPRALHRGYVPNTPPERRTRRNTSFQNTKSGAGEQFLLQDCRAKADTKCVISQAPVYVA